MNIELEDIKQLLRAELSASEGRTAELVAGLATKGDINEVRAEIKSAEERLGTKLDTVLDAIGERFNAAEEAIEAQQYKALERRIQVLEQLAPKLA